VDVVSTESEFAPSAARAVPLSPRTLSMRWSLALHRPIRVAGDSLITRHETHPEDATYHVVRTRDGALSRRLPWVGDHLPDNSWFHRGAVEAAADVVAVFEHERNVRGGRWRFFDTNDASLLWELDPDDGGGMTLVGRERRHALVQYALESRTRLEMREIRAGRVGWSRDVAGVGVVALRASSSCVVTYVDAGSDRTTFAAYSLGAGALLWRRTIARTLDRLSVCSVGARVVVCTSGLSVFALDVESGAELWSSALPAAAIEFSEIALFDDVAVVQWRRFTTVAFESRTGAIRWRVDQRFHCVRAEDDLLLATTRDRLWAVLDRADGRALWMYGGASGCRPEDESVQHDPGRDPELFLRVAGRLEAFGRDPLAEPTAPFVVTGTLRVHGAPARGVTVRLADSVVRTDGRGRYRVATTVAGPVELEVDDEALSRVVRGASASVVRRL
jgi:hypothetical protein